MDISSVPFRSCVPAVFQAQTTRLLHVFGAPRGRKHLHPPCSSTDDKLYTKDGSIAFQGIEALLAESFRLSELSHAEADSLKSRPRIDFSSIFSMVNPIVVDVRSRGDAAVIDYTARFDKVILEKIVEHVADLPDPELDPAVKEAFDVAYDNIYAFHIAQKSQERTIENMKGVRCKRVARCISSVGLYVPGGTAVLPSTALMLSVPAQIAGCKTVVLATPPGRDGNICKEVLYCAKKAGVTHILKAGGAQAISAMAWGTSSCPKVCVMRIADSKCNMAYMQMFHSKKLTAIFLCQWKNCIAGSFCEWKGILTRNFSFLLDMLTLLMALGHYLIIWWLRGMAFHVVDAILFLNLRALISGIIKRIRGYIKLRKALLSLNGALPDATLEELRAFDDECAICREPMARAKKLSCNHLFHLACLKSWLDQGLTEGYSCPTCRRPLFLSRSGDRTSSRGRGVANDEQRNAQINLGSNDQRITAPMAPSMQQQNPSDGVWRETGAESSWAPPRPSPAADDAGTSAVRSLGLGRVQMMMRHLASVGENYAHGSLDDGSWNIWPSPLPSGPSVPPSLRNGRTAVGLRFRNAAPPPSVSENMSAILAMADRVREVLPHIPDELIIQDLRRTNNVMVTVNNFLPT